MQTDSLQAYHHSLVTNTAAVATLKMFAPGRTFVVTHIGVVAETAHVVTAATISTSKLTIGVSAIGSTTDVVKETLSLTAAIATCVNVYKDMRKEGTSFKVEPGQIMAFKVATTTEGGTEAGTFYPYFLYYYEGEARNSTYEAIYT